MLPYVRTAITAAMFNVRNSLFLCWCTLHCGCVASSENSLRIASVSIDIWPVANRNPGSQNGWIFDITHRSTLIIHLFYTWTFILYGRDHCRWYQWVSGIFPDIMAKMFSDSTVKNTYAHFAGSLFLASFNSPVTNPLSRIYFPARVLGNPRLTIR